MADKLDYVPFEPAPIQSLTPEEARQKRPGYEANDDEDTVLLHAIPVAGRPSLSLAELRVLQDHMEHHADLVASVEQGLIDEDDDIPLDLGELETVLEHMKTAVKSEDHDHDT